MKTVHFLLRVFSVFFLKLVISLNLIYMPFAWSDEHVHEKMEAHDHGHAHEEESHDEGYEEEGHNEENHEEGVSHIDDHMAQKVGIITVYSGQQTLHQTITTYGRLVSAPEKTSHVLARFSGVITSVNVTIGDAVAAGDLLAVVESNDSLKKYDIRAPITGVVVQRHANAGEVTREQTLFSISSFDSLWLELRIFPSQRVAVSKGQQVFVHIGDQQRETIVAHLLPALDEHPYLLVRAKIDNSELLFSPGLMAEGHIVVAEFDAAVTVEKEALQTMEGQTGVFVKHNNTYTFTPLITGRKGERYVEVLSGLSEGMAYVTQNSYLVKADIEKSEAEHVH